MYKRTSVYGAVFFVQHFLIALFFAATVSVAATALSPLIIDRPNGAQVMFDVELALTNKQRQQGLMYRKELAPDKGMLFIFPTERMQSFWMRNTYIPLDIIFLRADGSIVNIVKNAEPETDTPRSSTAPAKAVLEIAGGRAAELQLAPGDTVRHALLGNVSSK